MSDRTDVVKHRRIMGESGSHLSMWCPGCDDLHAVRIGPNGWTWNGDHERPTFSPSILVTGGPDDARCHSYIREGQWQFLGDCTHDKRGTTVNMITVERWPYGG